MDTGRTVQKAIDYIEYHLAETLELERIAEAAHMSVPNLYRLFCSMTGHPVKEYIRKRRTSEAAARLRQTDLSAVDISFRCGFDNYKTFLNTFRRHTGLTPGDYRRSEMIFSFERISLHEHEDYREERRLSERFPDVKVVRLNAMKGIGYLHVSGSEEGLETEALARFRTLLASTGIDTGQIRVFGWNVDPEGMPEQYGYQLAAVGEGPACCERDQEHPLLKPVDLPGGMYASSLTKASPGPEVVETWNRLLSEWLPRSAFELGAQGFLEEYKLYGTQSPRLKLYLPVTRSRETNNITIVDRPFIPVMRFRAEGADCIDRADDASQSWLIRSGLANDGSLEVFMSNGYRDSLRGNSYYEISIAPPATYIPAPEEAQLAGRLDGGSYACMTTGAYGTMTGVLDMIYEWLDTSDDYEPDRNRSWYAHYTVDENKASKRFEGGIAERSVTVQCCVPVTMKAR